MARLAPYFPGIGAPWTSQTPLPGGDCGADGPDGLISALAAERPALSVAYLRRLVARHGSDADAVLGDARTMRDLGAAIGGSLYAREVAFLAREEWAREPDDVLWRRTRTGVWLAPEERIEAAAKIAALL